MERTQRIVNHQLVGARELASPHQDERPSGEVSAVVIHCICLPPGDLSHTSDIEALFGDGVSAALGKEFPDLIGLAVSAHLLIARDGSASQFVPFNKRAWHAGASALAGRAQVNDFAVGIELHGDDTVAYTSAQYHSLANVLSALMRAYPAISLNRIVGHCDVAPGRKSDPGPALQWEYLLGLITQPGTVNR